jgi:hypothetical protein
LSYEFLIGVEVIFELDTERSLDQIRGNSRLVKGEEPRDHKRDRCICVFEALLGSHPDIGRISSLLNHCK